MRENLETFFKAHKHAIARVAGVLFLAILVTVISVEAIHTKTAKQIQLVKQEQSSVKGTILAAPAVPVAPVPTTVSFGNIPDESFLPIAKGKIIRANLVTMQLTYYEDGVQIGGSMKILAKGKTGSFWETTGGSYPITDKEEDFIDRAVSPRINSRLGCQCILDNGSGTIEVTLPDQTQFLGE